MLHIIGAVVVVLIVIGIWKILARLERIVVVLGATWFAVAFVLSRLLSPVASVMQAKKGQANEGALADLAMYVISFGFGGGIAIICLGLLLPLLRWFFRYLGRRPNATNQSLLQVLEDDRQRKTQSD